MHGAQTFQLSCLVVILDQLDGNGRSGGCQYTYTVIANPDPTVDCDAIVLSVPLKVNITSSTGGSPIGTPGQVSVALAASTIVSNCFQCTDLTVTPLTGTPPFTYTVG